MSNAYLTPPAQPHRTAYRWILLLSMWWLALAGLAQEQPMQPINKREVARQEKLQKQLIKERKQVEKANAEREAAEYERAKKRHESIQSDKTRKRMKMRAKNAGKNYGNRKPSLWRRLFGKRRNT